MFIRIHPEGVPCPAKSGNHGGGQFSEWQMMTISDYHTNNVTVTPWNLLPLQAGLPLKNAIADGYPFCDM